jgi:hypothetical protein
MGMTWKLKVGRVAFVLAVVAGMALALGADYWENCWSSLF